MADDCGGCLCQIACFCFIKCVAELCHEACKEGCCEKCCRAIGCECCCPVEPAGPQRQQPYSKMKDKKNRHPPGAKPHGHYSSKPTAAGENNTYPEAWAANLPSEEQKVNVYDDTYYTQAQQQLLANQDGNANTNVIEARPYQMAEPNDDALSAYYQQLKEQQNKAYDYK